MADPEPPAGPGLDALLDALPPDQADAMLAELLQGEPAPPDRYASKPAEIRACLKDLAARRPDLIAKIITHWLNEERRTR